MDIIALDQGTSSSRALRFDLQGNVVDSKQLAITQHYPQLGWVEHDPMEIWQTQLTCLQDVLNHAPHQVQAIGITNQRETTVIWERATGKPIYPAIVWQDRRTTDVCEQYQQSPFAKDVTVRTGLPIDPYFSATKVAWILDHVADARNAAFSGKLAFGTIDSWLIWQLTHGKMHATDVTNASRTLLMNLKTGQWDQDLLDFFDIPHQILPKILYSHDDFGQTDPSITQGYAIPIQGVAGDQQAALFGHHITQAGQSKITYGTGCFLLAHTGNQIIESSHQLISTRAAQIDDMPQFALEGSVFMGGALIQWLRDELQIILHSDDIEALANQVEDSLGVIIVPSFTGMGAPYWKSQARGTIFGLTRATTKAHIARAALEAIAWQNTDIIHAIEQDLEHYQQKKLLKIFVDGGASLNDLLMQLQANQTQLELVRPWLLETTAWGAAQLAALSLPEFNSVSNASVSNNKHTTFKPSCQTSLQQAFKNWQKAVITTCKYFDEPNS